MIKKEDLRIIVPKHGFSAPLLENEGYDVEDPYLKSNFFSRQIRKYHLNSKLPGRVLWYNRNNICEKKYILVYASFYITSEYIEWLKKNNPRSNIAIFYNDPAGSSAVLNPYTIIREGCSLWTGDNNDAIKYGMHYVTTGGYFKNIKPETSNIKYDVFYIGRDKGRKQQLDAIKRFLENYGLSCNFYITAPRRYSINLKKEYKPMISYQEVVNYIGSSKAILHIGKGCSKGLSLRIQESLLFYKKLITDDVEIKRYDYYSPNNIFILGQDNPHKLREFIDSPFIKPDTLFYSNPYIDDMINQIFTS